MSTKKQVRMKNARLRFELGVYKLTGQVLDHPRFPKNQQITTSTILKIETKNTIYILGNNAENDTD